MNGGAAQDPPVQGRDPSEHNDNASVCSGLSESSKMSVWSQAAMILRGENPAVTAATSTIQEETSQDLILGRSVSASRDDTAATPRVDNLSKHQNGDDDSTAIINFLDDDPKTMTYSRKLALFLMKRYAWYNPGLHAHKKYETDDELYDNNKEQPSGALLEAYPFTHSRRENPSLVRACDIVFC